MHLEITKEAIVMN